MGKLLSNSIARHRETVRERKSQSTQQTSLSYSKKLPQRPQPSATSSLMCQQPSAQNCPPTVKQNMTQKMVNNF